MGEGNQAYVDWEFLLRSSGIMEIILLVGAAPKDQSEPSAPPAEPRNSVSHPGTPQKDSIVPSSSLQNNELKELPGECMAM